MDVRRIELALVFHPALLRQILVQRSAGNRRVQHELVEVRIVLDGSVDDSIDVLRCVIFQADDGRTQDADPVRLQFSDQFQGVRPVQLGVAAVLALDSHPDPRNSQADQLVDRIRTQHVRRAENVQGPGFVVLLHQFQQPQRTAPMQQEVLVHHEERADLHPLLHLGHHLEQFVTGVVEVDEFTLAAEHGRCRTKIAAQGTTHRGNHRGGDVSRLVTECDAHVPGSVAGDNQRMANRLAVVLAQEPPHPADALALDHIIHVDAVFQIGNIGDVPPHHDLRRRLVVADQLAHGSHFALVGNDRADADHVVVPLAKLLDEPLPCRKIQYRTGGFDIRLDHH